MSLVIKGVKGRKYYYSFVSYFLITGSKSFSKYIGAQKPTRKDFDKIEDQFKNEIMVKLSNRQYTTETLGKDDVIRSLLFRNLFNKKYEELTALNRRKYDIDSTVLFTLTTLTTEEVDVNIDDVKNALTKDYALTKREQISRNMLNAVESIKQPNMLDKKYLLGLHKMIMADFETKNPGRIRDRQVYLHRANKNDHISVELEYRPPKHTEVSKLLDKFIYWYKNNSLNPIEKATVAHYKLYRVHPFLDGNKRICRLVFNKILLDEGFPLLNISMEKEKYFEALIKSVEEDQVKVLVEFTLKQYYKQVKDFLAKV